jgi:hypothetical protein
MSLSLRSFHVFFIAVSIVLSAWVGVWEIGSYRAGGGGTSLAFAGLFFLVGFVLLLYWVRVRRKFREMAPEE